jgi:hypothetical protein
MAQKLKSQDLMELFNQKLDEVNKKFDWNEKIITTVDGKLEEIKRTSVKIEFEPLKEVIKKNAESFENHKNELIKISEEHQEKIKASVRKQVKNQLYFYYALSILFCLCTAFLAFGINQYNKKNFAENEMKFYSKEAHRRNTYLKEKNLTEKYEIWLERKQK